MHVFSVPVYTITESEYLQFSTYQLEVLSKASMAVAKIKTQV